MPENTFEQIKGLKNKLRKEARKKGVDFNSLKSGGFIKQTQPDLYVVRLRTPAGMVSFDQP